MYVQLSYFAVRRRSFGGLGGGVGTFESCDGGLGGRGDGSLVGGDVFGGDFNDSLWITYVWLPENIGSKVSFLSPYSGDWLVMYGALGTTKRSIDVSLPTALTPSDFHPPTFPSELFD